MEDNKQMLANLLHTAFCSRSHSVEMIEMVTGRKKNFCYWYPEQTMTDCWELEDHEYWTMMVDIIFDLIPEDGRKEFLEKLLKFCLDFMEVAEYGEGVQMIIYNLLYRGEEE